MEVCHDGCVAMIHRAQAPFLLKPPASEPTRLHFPARFPGGCACSWQIRGVLDPPGVRRPHWIAVMCVVDCKTKPHLSILVLVRVKPPLKLHGYFGYNESKLSFTGSPAVLGHNACGGGTASDLLVALRRSPSSGSRCWHAAGRDSCRRAW